MKQFVISLTLATNAGGDTTTAYYTDGPGWATLATDTPGSTWIEGRVLDPGSIRRELFSGSKVHGAVRPSFGEIVLANSDGALDGWLAYGIDGQPITIWYGEEGAAFPSGYTQVLKVYGHTLVADFDSVRVRVRDRLQLMEVPFCTTTFAGTGDLEGSSDIAGKVKPRTSKDPGYHPVTLVDSVKLIYFVTASGTGGLASSFKLYEGGVEITRGSNYATAADVVTTSPSSGQCRFWFGTDEDGPVYVRLGSVPVYELRCLSFGYNSAGTAINLAEECGISGATASPYAIRYVDDGATTYLDVAEEGAKIGPIYFGLTRLDAYQTGTLTAPGATAAHVFTQHNAHDFRRTPVDGLHAPIRRITYDTGETWPCTCASGAGSTLQDYLGRDPWYWSHAMDNDVLDKHPGAPVLAITDLNRSIQNATYADTILNSYVALFGVERDFISLVAPFDADTLALELHNTVEVRIPRFGLTSGKKFRVISIELKLRSREIAFGLWG